MNKIASNKNPLVSVIVSTKNAASTLDNCLKSIRQQDYPCIELIVVDNYSNDNTIAVAKKYADKILNKGSERSMQRNFGVKNSSGEFIAWFDADMELDKKVVRDCVAAIQTNEKLDALIIPEVSRGNTFWAKCKALEKRCYLGDAKIEAVRFIKKNTFNQVGKMAENFISGEDWDLTTRLRENRHKIDRIKSVVFHNEGNLNLRSSVKKKFYYATKSLPYVNKHIKGPYDILLFVFRPAFIRNWRLLLFDPTHTFGLFVLKSCEFAAGLLGILYAKFKMKNRYENR